MSRGAEQLLHGQFAVIPLNMSIAAAVKSISEMVWGWTPQRILLDSLFHGTAATIWWRTNNKAQYKQGKVHSLINRGPHLQGSPPSAASISVWAWWGRLMGGGDGGRLRGGGWWGEADGGGSAERPELFYNIWWSDWRLFLLSPRRIAQLIKLIYFLVQKSHNSPCLWWHTTVIMEGKWVISGPTVSPGAASERACSTSRETSLTRFPFNTSILSTNLHTFTNLSPDSYLQFKMSCN